VVRLAPTKLRTPALPPSARPHRNSPKTSLAVTAADREEQGPGGSELRREGSLLGFDFLLGLEKRVGWSPGWFPWLLCDCPRHDGYGRFKQNEKQQH